MLQSPLVLSNHSHWWYDSSPTLLIGIGADNLVQGAVNQGSSNVYTPKILANITTTLSLESFLLVPIAFLLFSMFEKCFLGFSVRLLNKRLLWYSIILI